MKTLCRITMNEMTDALACISRANRNIPNMTNLFNWAEIAKLQLPAGFIEENYRNLPWDVLARYQEFDMDLVGKFEYIIKNHLDKLVINSNLNSEVFKYFANRMDWELAQQYQRFTPELLNYFRDQLDLLIIIQHQKLPEDFITESLQQFISSSQWRVLRKYLDLIFNYQKVSISFIMEFLRQETQIDCTLVDLSIVLKKQELSEEFIRAFCMNDPEIVSEICRSQKLTNAFISDYFDLLHKRRLLKYQKMEEPLLVRCYEQLIRKPALVKTPITREILEQAVDIPEDLLQTGLTSIQTMPAEETQLDRECRLHLANVLIQNQVYSIELAKTIINEFADCKREIDILWINVFIRSLARIGDDGYLGFSNTTIENEIMPNVDWNRFADCQLTSAQTDAAIEIASKHIPWYLYSVHNHLSEQQIEHLHSCGALSATDWWILLTMNRFGKNYLDYHFAKKHENKAKWWMHITNPGEFYSLSLEAIDNIEDKQLKSRTDLRTFLQDFVDMADWANILRYEQLPEWFMRLFGHPSIFPKIDKYWWRLSRWQKLSPAFIERNIEKLDLQTVLRYQTLPESFIRDVSPFFTQEHWNTVASSQTLSPQFRSEFAEQLGEPAN